VLVTQDNRRASTYACTPGYEMLIAERSACRREYYVFQLGHYISIQEAIAEGNDARVRELCESMCGLSVSEMHLCPLLSDDSRLQMIPRYRHLVLLCVDHKREDLACWMLQQQHSDYAISDNLVV